MQRLVFQCWKYRLQAPETPYFRMVSPSLRERFSNFLQSLSLWMTKFPDRKSESFEISHESNWEIIATDWISKKGKQPTGFKRENMDKGEGGQHPPPPAYQPPPQQGFPQAQPAVVVGVPVVPQGGMMLGLSEFPATVVCPKCQVQSIALSYRTEIFTSPELCM